MHKFEFNFQRKFQQWDYNVSSALSAAGGETRKEKWFHALQVARHAQSHILPLCLQLQGKINFKSVPSLIIVSSEASYENSGLFPPMGQPLNLSLWMHLFCNVVSVYKKEDSNAFENSNDASICCIAVSTMPHAWFCSVIF